MSTPWKVLVLALVGYSIWMTLAVADLANSAEEQGWSAEFHESKGFADTVWGAEKLGKIHVAIGLLAVVAGVVIVIELAAKRRAPAA